MLKDGLHDVPAGRIATVVTHLEMTAPAASRPAGDLSDLELRRVTDPDPDWYRALYTRVGALDWLWFSRLTLPAEALARVIRDPAVHVHALCHEGVDVGLVELDFREPGTCELAFFGVTAEMQGRGAGRLMMNRAIGLAFVPGIERFRVHTCTLDHPAALPFYRRSGFVAVRQQVEIAPDPRLTGVLPDTAGPHVPVFRRS